MYNWQGKRLLVLGAVKLLEDVVRQAQKNGIYVIVTDYLKDSPAKKIADESHMISITDVDRIVELIKEREIDGVLTGYIDFALPYYYEVCRKAGLPCYITSEQIAFATDKKIFKQHCRKYHIPVIAEYQKDAAITYPVIVKPVDNSGSRGISICNNKAELDHAIDVALEMSPSKQYLIEQYLTYQEATVFYLFNEGEIHCTLMGNRHVSLVKEGAIRLPTGYSFPSEYTENYMHNIHPKMVKMLDALQCQNGMLFMQGFIDENGQYIPYEIGFRLTGSLEYILLENVCGYNPVDMIINFALTGKMTDKKFNPVDAVSVPPCYNISCLLRPGEIASIEGIEALKNSDGIVDVRASYDVGDVLPEDVWGKLAQIGVRLLLTPKHEDDYQRILKRISNELRVINTAGEDMVINYAIKK